MDFSRKDITYMYIISICLLKMVILPEMDKKNIRIYLVGMLQELEDFLSTGSPIRHTWKT